MRANAREIDRSGPRKVAQLRRRLFGTARNGVDAESRYLTVKVVVPLRKRLSCIVVPCKRFLARKWL